MNTELKMKRCGIIITYRCNLKCKLCTAYSPYYKKPPHFSYESLALSIDKYFSMVSFVDKFTVSGGEPLIHDELEKIMKHLLEYSNQIGTIEIITNGTIVPKISFLKVINGCEKISFLIDDYGDHLSTKISSLEELFSKNRINYSVRNNNEINAHCNGWIDFGDFTQKWFAQEDIDGIFNKCAIPQKMNFCFTIKNGEIHPCGPSYRCMELGVIPKNENEFIDLLSENTTVNQKREKLIDIQKCSSLTACKFCNGMCEDSPRFPPAEQLD